MNNQHHLVELKNIQFKWDEHSPILLDIESFSVRQGEHVFIRGDSGSGKTTLLNLLSGIRVSTQGSIEILGTNINLLTQKQRDLFRAQHLGIIFQQFNLLPFLSVRDNINLPNIFSQNSKNIHSDIDTEITRLCQSLALPETILDTNVSNLSVGQQQRVAVCRALIGKPEVIIADEPTSALDSKNRDSFLSLLFNEAEKNSSTILFVSHDEQIAKRFPRTVELNEINQAAAAK